MTAVTSGHESLLELDAEHWLLDPKPGVHAYLNEASRRLQPESSTSDHMDDFADFLAHAGLTPQGSQSAQQQQQASQAELALDLAVKPARPPRQRIRSKEVNRRNQRSYREKRKVGCSVGAKPLHCFAYCRQIAWWLAAAKSCCISDVDFVPCRLSCKASKQS
jgi:hypothetical protein